MGLPRSPMKMLTIQHGEHPILPEGEGKNQRPSCPLHPDVKHTYCLKDSLKGSFNEGTLLDQSLKMTTWDRGSNAYGLLSASVVINKECRHSSITGALWI